jgi:hypothetical protein
MYENLNIHPQHKPIILQVKDMHFFHLFIYTFLYSFTWLVKMYMYVFRIN